MSNRKRSGHKLAVLGFILLIVAFGLGCMGKYSHPTELQQSLRPLPASDPTDVQEVDIFVMEDNGGSLRKLTDLNTVEDFGVWIK
jgi:hypothetical protein